MNKDLNITDEEYKEITAEPKVPIKLNIKNYGTVKHNINYYFIYYIETCILNERYFHTRKEI